MDDMLERMAKLAEEAKEQQERYRTIVREEVSSPSESFLTELREVQAIGELQQRTGSLEECMEASRHALKGQQARDESNVVEGLSESVPSPRRLVRSALGAVSHKAQDYYEGAKEKASHAYTATQDGAQLVMLRARHSFAIGPDSSGEETTAVSTGSPQTGADSLVAVAQSPTTDESRSGKPFEGETIREAMEFKQRETESLEKEGGLHGEVTPEEPGENRSDLHGASMYAEVVASVAAEMIGLEHRPSRHAEVDFQKDELVAGKKTDQREHNASEHEDGHSGHAGGWQKVRELVRSKHDIAGLEGPKGSLASGGMLTSEVEENVQGTPKLNTEEPAEEDSRYHEATVMQISLN